MYRNQLYYMTKSRKSQEQNKKQKEHTRYSCCGLPQHYIVCEPVQRTGGETQTHTHNTEPQRRRTTAGRTAQTNQAADTAGREERGTQRQPNGAPRARHQRRTERAKGGTKHGRGKRTKKNERTTTPTSQSGQNSRPTKSQRKEPRPNSGSSSPHKRKEKEQKRTNNIEKTSRKNLASWQERQDKT